MKEIIKAIIAAAMCSDSETIDKIKENYRRSFISGEYNNKIKEDIESINVKGLNYLLNDILEADYPIEDKIKAIEQWDDIMTDYVKYISDMRDSAKESYDKLFAKYEASKATIYSVFYCSENHLVFLDKNDKLRKSFNSSAKTLYSGNSKDEARRICESFLKDCPDFYCVDYTKIYNK
jgi:hypothetical protein|nr:MAG TPA: hypothetical protein [Crassvirales sp.]